jgi:hypothetical protein
VSLSILTINRACYIDDRSVNALNTFEVLAPIDEQQTANKPFTSISFLKHIAYRGMIPFPSQSLYENVIERVGMIDDMYSCLHVHVSTVANDTSRVSVWGL